MLAQPAFKERFIFGTDASNFATGAGCFRNKMSYYYPLHMKTDAWPNQKGNNGLPERNNWPKYILLKTLGTIYMDTILTFTLITSLCDG